MARPAVSIVLSEKAQEKGDYFEYFSLVKCQTLKGTVITIVPALRERFSLVNNKAEAGRASDDASVNSAAPIVPRRLPRCLL